MATIRKRGEYQWEVQIRKKGFPSQSKTFNTYAEAEAWAAIIESEMVRGVFVSRTEAESTTLAQALARYEREITPSKKGAAQELSRLNVLRKLPLTCRFLASIHGSDIAALRDQRAAEGWAAASIVRELAIISHVFNVARREWGMESLGNPVELIRRPTIRNERERRITEAIVWQQDAEGNWTAESLDELQMLTRVTESEDLPDIVTIAVETAMRRSEILGLQRQHVDTKRRVAKLLDTKNGSAREVPLSSKAVAVFEARPVRLDGRIFGMTDDAATRAFARAVARGRAAYETGLSWRLAQDGLPPHQVAKHLESDTFLVDLRFHDLRHEATSRLADIYPMHELARITGHRDTRMLLRYYHPRAEDLAKKLA